MARTTPGTGIPVPESPDPRTITADLWASFSKVGTLITQTSGESAAALTTSQAAHTAAAQALAIAALIEEPVHVGPNPPTDGETLWVDTDEDAPPAPVSSEDITDATDVGRAVLTAPLSVDARNALAIYTGTRALLDAGMDTAERTWDAKELSEYVTSKATALDDAKLEQVRDIGSRDLDAVVSTGVYEQSFSSNATLARHYPAGSLTAGKLRVVSNSSGSMVTQQYITYTRDDVRWNIRNYFGSWGPWTEVNLGSRKGQGVVIDARPWMVAPHSWFTATKLAVNGASVTLTISGQTGAAITGGTVVGNVPADYRPLVEMYSLGQNIGGEGARFMTNGDITFPSVNTGTNFKVSTNWTR